MIDFSHAVHDLDGEPMKDPAGKVVTIGSLVETALMLPYDDERNLAGEEKVHRAVLAMRIHAGPVELTAEDIALCKKTVGKAYPPLTVMRVWEVLDPASVK
jgi:hypothetical protein